MFSSLKIREFRIFWMAMFVSLVGSWVQTMAQSWLVFRMTRSAFLMGLVGFLGYLPISVFSLPAGVMVDRTVKRNLIIVTQLLFTILAFAMAFLVQTHKIQIWHIMVIAFINGLVLSLDAPARQSMVVELVGKQHLMNAIALNSAIFNSARIIGPALAGILIAVIGTSGCFFVNAISYLPVLLALFLIKPNLTFINKKTGPIGADIKEGFVLIKNDKFLLILLCLVGLVSTFGVSFLVLMPIFAQDVLRSGAPGLAALMSATGLGALLGALNVARLKETQLRLKTLNSAVILFFSAGALFALSKSLMISSLLLVAAGFGISGSTSIINALLQFHVPDAYRGRVMSVYVMMFMGFIPLGNIVFGTLAHFFGAPAVVLFGSLACLLFYVSINKKYLNILNSLMLAK